jgi:hypothetical protein
MKNLIFIVIAGAMSLVACAPNQTSSSTPQERYAANFTSGNTWVMKATPPGGSAVETFVFQPITSPVRTPANSLYVHATVGASKGMIFTWARGTGFYMVAFRNPNVVLEPVADEGNEEAVYCFVQDKDQAQTHYFGLAFFGTGTKLGSGGISLSESDPKLGRCEVIKQ